MERKKILKQYTNSLSGFENAVSDVIGIHSLSARLRTKIKLYLDRIHQIEKHLEKFPDDWGLFQVEFNAELSSIFQDIMDYEKMNVLSGTQEKTLKLKRLFVKKIRPLFIRKGTLAEYSLLKPYGYAGDFKIIDYIYQNNPWTTGINRLFDNYFQMSSISIAVRNRKEDFKRMIIDFVKQSSKEKINVMNLACGPCRELKELALENPEIFSRLNVDCYDHEKDALSCGMVALSGAKNINFIKRNVLLFDREKDGGKTGSKHYDLIYSMGFFDYLNDRISIRVLRKLKNSLADNQSFLIIADIRDRDCNPSVHFMEWVGEWNLIYRDDEKFKGVFRKVGGLQVLKVSYEQQGLMRYAIGKKA